MNSKEMTARVGEQEWLAPIEESLQKAVEATYSAAGPARAPIEDALHGVWLGHALHPALVSIPIGAWTAAAVMDTMEAVWGRDDLAAGADTAVGIGIAGAVAAAATGLTDWYLLSEKPQKRVGALHATLNIAALALYACSWMQRRAGNRGMGRALGYVAFTVVNSASYLGGSMVAELKVSVDHAEREELPGRFTRVLADGDLPEGAPTNAKLEGGASVVLVRQGKRIRALGNICSHLGGPLSEGAVEDDCIVCPWHRSAFRLTDGSVARGPATFGQPLYEARIRDGYIEVRAPNIAQNRE